MAVIKVYNPRNGRVMLIKADKAGRKNKRYRFFDVVINGRRCCVYQCFVRRRDRYIMPACYHAKNCRFGKKDRERGCCKGRNHKGCRHEKHNNRCELYYVQEQFIKM